MTDYTRGTGNSGTMLIRDFWPGSNAIELWLTANNSTTWNAALPWGYTINGVTWNGTYNYQPGAGWARLGVFNVNYSQTVQFRLGNTGTSGFGGPTTFNQFLQRSTVPPPPTIVTLSNIQATSMDASFYSLGDGGSPITLWQLGYGLDPSTPQTIVTYTTAPKFVGGLTSGLTYYFWGRGVNALGNGAWGPRGQATTLRVPDTPGSLAIANLTQLAATATFTLLGDGGTPITQSQVGWSVSPTGDPTSSVTVTSQPQAISGLLPATTYYFRTRARNLVGWSPWSPTPTSARTIAGARVKVGPVWKEAIPYVRVDGVWRVARPWGRQAGVWKESV